MGMAWLPAQGLPEGAHAACSRHVLSLTNRSVEQYASGQFRWGHDRNETDSLYHVLACRRGGEWQYELFSDLQAALDSWHPQRDLLVYVHGDGKTFGDIIRRCAMLEETYELDVIAFDWPSKIPEYGILRNFYHSRKNARKSVDLFGRFLTEFAAYRRQHERGRASLFCHSLGNYLLMKYINSGQSRQLPAGLFDNVVLNSAAVRQRNHRKWVQNMHFQRAIYITTNRNDYILKGASFATLMTGQLGRRWKRSAENATYLRFDALVGRSHNYFMPYGSGSNPHIHALFYELLHGRPPAGQERLTEGKAVRKQ